jgi:hypothetical protein
LAVAALGARWGALGAAMAWSGRIVLDTVVLMLCADRKTPGYSVPRWQIAHCLGLVVLLVPLAA